MKDYQKITFRLVKASDHRFIRNLYCHSREQEMTIVDWSKHDKKAFLHKQFSLQQKHIFKTYPHAIKQLILDGDIIIGIFYTNISSAKEHYHLIDISLKRECQGQGIGSYLLNQWMTLTHNKTNKFSLYVQIGNYALNLY